MPGSGKGRIVLIVAVLLLAGLIMAAWLEYRRDIHEQRRRVSTGSRMASTRCGPIEYAAVGSGPPVLVVHGAGGGWDQGFSLGSELAKEGLRIIAMSRFGYLRTPLPTDRSAEAQADAHACLLDTLAIPRAAIIGASAGAPSSVQFVLRHPDRATALVLLVPGIYAPRPGGAPPLKTPPWTRFLFETALKSDFLLWAAIRFARPIVIRSILATPPEVVRSADPAERARAAEILRRILPVSARRLGLINDAAVTSALPRYDLERIAVPTLTISMADDLYGTYDGAHYTAEHVPLGRFKGFPSGGHVWIGHHEEILKEIVAFLKSCPKL